MSFGFGVGDFIACSKLIKSVITGLSDAAGSVSEVESITKVLNSLNDAVITSQVIWDQIAKTEMEPEILLIFGALAGEHRKQQERLMQSLQSFVKFTMSYDKGFNESFWGRSKRSYKKITWQLRKDEAAILENRLNGHLRTFNQSYHQVSMLQAFNNNQIGTRAISMITTLNSRVETMSQTLQSMSIISSKSLGYTWESSIQDTVLLLDALDRSILLPMILLSSRDDMHFLAKLMFKGIAGCARIERREYTITNEETDDELNENNWHESLRPGMRLSLNVVLPATSSVNLQSCPRCREVTRGHNLSRQRRRCHKCQLTFLVQDKERFLGDSVAGSSTNLETPTSEDTMYQSQHLPISKVSEEIHKCRTREDEPIFRRVHFHRDKWVKKQVMSTVSKDEAIRDYNINALPQLHSAAARGDVIKLNRLIEEDKLDVNAKVDLRLRFTEADGRRYNIEGFTSLHLACWHGKLQVMHSLLAKGADIHARDSYGEQPSWYAIAGHSPEKILYPLLALGADVHATNNSPNAGAFNLLQQACWMGQNGIVNYLLSQNLDVTVRCSDGYTPLAYAALSGNKDVFDTTLEYGAQVDILPNKWQHNALHFAARGGSGTITKYLLDHGIDFTAREAKGRTPLHEACFKGHLDVVDALVAAGASLQDNDDFGSSALHYACYEGHFGVVQGLLRLGTMKSINHQDLGGKTALFLACCRGYHDIVVALIAAGASVMLRDTENCTPQHMACVYGHLSIVQALVAADRDSLSAVDREGSTPLHLACNHGHETVVDTLLLAGAPLDSFDQDGYSPLHHACISGNLATVKRILKEERHNLMCGDIKGRTPLHLAARKGSDTIVDAVLLAGASVVRYDDNGDSPLHDACRSGSVVTVRRLLKEDSVDLLHKNNFGATAIYVACIVGNNEIVQLLLDSGSIISEPNNTGRLPLHEAILGGNLALIKLLLEARPSTSDSVDEEGDPALCFACYRQNLSIVSHLIDLGANVNVRNKAGQSPIHIAVRYSTIEVVQLLLDNGANVHSRDSGGNTPIHLAMRWASLSTVRLLGARGVDLNCRNDDGWSVIRFAAMRDVDEISEFMDALKEMGAEVTNDDRDW